MFAAEFSEAAQGHRRSFHFGDAGDREADSGGALAEIDFTLVTAQF